MTEIKNVLFLCPHGAAKSVLAMTYFTDLANQAGLEISAKNAGTEPDPTINPKVDAHLNDEGFDLSRFIPPLLKDADLETANLVVSIGCIEADQVPAGTRFLDWSDVPMLSDDFRGSRDKIYSHVVELVAELKS
ncbi:MAG: hypothetical protein AAGD96_18475 [Chloroflexota bacterium]